MGNPGLSCLLCAIALSLLHTVVARSGYQKLVAAVKQASANGKACKLSPGCLGKAVTLVLKEDVVLRGCVIDGGFKHQVFSPFFLEGNLPVSRLELANLIFQKAKGGVLADVWTRVIGRNLVFRRNIDGVIRGIGRSAYPSHSYINCRFNYNNGTAISFGSSQYGLSSDKTGISVQNSIFYKNQGYASEFDFGGGAVYVAGFGIAIFENVKFHSNTAVTSGGALYADSTQVKLKRVTFNKNKARKGSGGAVFGQSYIYNQLRISFCRSTFNGNTAPSNKKSDSLFFQAYVPEGFTPTKVTFNFCNTALPPGSVFPSKANGTVNTGRGKTCRSKYC